MGICRAWYKVLGYKNQLTRLGWRIPVKANKLKGLKFRNIKASEASICLKNALTGSEMYSCLVR